MQDFVVTEESDVSILADFYCGLPFMDEYIHDGRLQTYLSQHSRTFFVVRSECYDIVAMFVISKGVLYLDEDCKEDLEMKFPGFGTEPLIAQEWQTGMFPSLEIDYLAVREDCRGTCRHIGSWAIRKIMSFASKYENPLFLSVAAYYTKEYSAIPFYHKNGFWAAQQPCTNIDTVKMYRIIDVDTAD